MMKVRQGLPWGIHLLHRLTAALGPVEIGTTDGQFEEQIGFVSFAAQADSEQEICID